MAFSVQMMAETLLDYKNIALPQNSLKYQEFLNIIFCWLPHKFAEDSK